MALRQVIDNLLANVRTHTPSGHARRRSCGPRSTGARGGARGRRRGPGLDAGGRATGVRALLPGRHVALARPRAAAGSGWRSSPRSSPPTAAGSRSSARPGDGATFRVHLPLAPAARRDRPDRRRRPSRPAGRLLARRTREPRRPLLAVRGEPLGRVGTTEAVELVGERRVEHRAEHPVPVVQRVLRPADRALRAVGELARRSSSASSSSASSSTHSDTSPIRSASSPVSVRHVSR